VFGAGGDLDEAAWRNVFRQLVALGYVRPDHEAYGALRLTEASRPLLKGELRVEMRHVAPRRGKTARARNASISASVPAADAGLLERLTTWRLSQAREQSVPAYVIFHDRTLAAIAAARPRDLGALAGIDGIGGRKLDRYGPALLQLIQK
jgi:ATP-dependent DNA helicase RecQ